MRIRLPVFIVYHLCIGIKTKIKKFILVQEILKKQNFILFAKQLTNINNAIGILIDEADEIAGGCNIRNFLERIVLYYKPEATKHD